MERTDVLSFLVARVTINIATKNYWHIDNCKHAFKWLSMTVALQLSNNFHCSKLSVYGVSRKLSAIAIVVLPGAAALLLHCYISGIVTLATEQHRLRTTLNVKVSSYDMLFWETSQGRQLLCFRTFLSIFMHFFFFF